MGLSNNNAIVASDAPKGKGGAAEAVRPIQENAMLNVAERPAEGKASKVVDAKFHSQSPTRKAQLWLDDQIDKAGKTVTSIVTDLTPELAAVLLERNPANRPVKAYKVQDYTHDIKNGTWKFNGEPVIVANDGLLNDGQHRCTAVLEAQKAIKVVMVFGVDRDTRDTLDQGANRTAGDYLGLHGFHSTNNLAAVAKALWQWRTYGMLSSSGRHTPTRSEVLKTVADNPGLVKSFEFVNRKNARAMGSPSMLGFCHFAFKAVAGDISANYFMDALIDGINLKSGDPILTIRNRLIMDRKSLRAPDRAELLFRAWNAHRLEQTRVLFRVTGGELPLLEA
jgi:hypothetical protein